MRPSTTVVLHLVVSLTASFASAFSPTVSENSFDGYPKDLVHFEDTSNVIYHDSQTDKVYLSSNDGETWNPINQIKNTEKIQKIIQHPFDKTRAYILTDNKIHYFTTDSGITWKQFSTPEDPAGHILATNWEVNDSPLIFNSQKSDYVIFAGSCVDSETNSNDIDDVCNRQFYFSDDALLSYSKLIQAHSCLFMNSASNLKEQVNKDNIVCAMNTQRGLSLVKSSDFFNSGPDFIVSKGGIVTGAEMLGFTDGSLFAIGGNFIRPDDKFVYVSEDGSNWEQYKLPDTVSVGSDGKFSILESITGTINLHLQGGKIYGSNDKNEFELRLEELNEDDQGNYYDYEALEGLPGVILANTKSQKMTHSYISHDNAHSWSDIEVSDCSGSSSDCTLNLHSTVHRKSIGGESSDSGKYYSSKVPGVLIGVGNTGKFLKTYEEGDTYISTTGGSTWFKALTGPHVFEIGDSGSIVIAMETGKASKILKYSLNFGKTWSDFELDQSIEPSFISTTTDSTSYKFILFGKSGNAYKTLAIDFQGVYDSSCLDTDFENWSISDASGSSICTMGLKQVYKRRKIDSSCSVGNLYNEALSSQVDCSCSSQDFTCSEGYKMKQGKCVITISLEEEIVDSQCVNGKKHYVVPNGMILKEGNTCSKDFEADYLQDIKKECPSVTKGLIEQREDDDDSDDSENPDEEEGAPENSDQGKDDGKVKTSIYTFRGKVKDYIYMEKPMESESDDETLLALTSQNEVFVTHNQGSSWEEVSPDREFLSIHLNPYFPDQVYLMATHERVVYSKDRADTWKSFRVPSPPIPGVKPLYFHPERPHYVIYIGQEGCEDPYSKACRPAAYVTRSYGKRWKKLQENIKTCQFLPELQKDAHGKLIACEKLSNEATNFKSDLIISGDDFTDDIRLKLENVIGLVKVDNFLVAATSVGQDELRAHVSLDGTTWNDALFPANFHVDKQQAFTTLSGATQAIFLHVTTNPRENTEFGSLLKSNRAGQSYVLSLDNVNRDQRGYVDFEQMSGLEGVIVVNTVDNPSDAKRGSRKNIKSMITHNDGAQWSLVQPPFLDSESNKYSCSGQPLEKCSLHLHGYTEREDYRDTFSSQSAVGMMVGIGNVGDKLENYYDGNTYLTRDGGITWKEVKKGVYMWEYGDQGSIIVLVNGKDNTNTLSYSLDEGETWNDYKFTDESVTVEDISTVPSDNSLKFLLFTRVPLSRGDKTRVFQIDFSQLLKDKCNLDLQHPDVDDFELWTPEHPFQPDKCLFGHEVQYYRKVAGKLCRIGKKLTQPYKVVRNCACTRQDYECDFNYYRDSSGACRLVPGYNQPDHSEICLGDDAPTEYYLPTGYRKIPLSSCEGGQEFDKSNEPKPCKGKEEDFYKKHPGKGWFATLFIWLVCLGIFAFFAKFGYKLYQNKYGEIRLDDGGEFSMIENDGNYIQQFKNYSGQVLVTSIALTSQAIRYVALNAKELRSRLKMRLTGRYEPASTSAYIVTDEDANEFAREQEEQLNNSDNSNGGGFQDDPILSDDEQDLGGLGR